MTLFLAVCCIMSSSCGGGGKNNTVTTVDTVPMMVMQIQKCSRLYTAECKVHKIVTHEDQKRLKGKLFNRDFDVTLPLGSRKVAIPIDVTLKAYIDFGTFNKSQIIRDGRKITVILPDPNIVLTSSRVNHDEIKRFVAFTRSSFTDAELSSYERQGRQSVIDNLPQTDIVEQARASAAIILVPMIRQMGYKEEDITITFRKNFNGIELKKMLDFNEIKDNGKDD